MSFAELWRTYTFTDVATRVASGTPSAVRRALSRVGAGLDLNDLAALLSPAAEAFLEEMAVLSQRITVGRFGRTMQLFAPLYLTNTCINVCTYCGFSAENRMPRKVLNDAEILAEIAVLKTMGFDHVLFVTGETSRHGRGYFANAIRLLRPHFSSISMEVQPLSSEDYASLAADGLSAVIAFQETYDPDTYPRHHLRGPKADMIFRLETPDRLGQAGLKKIGLGALYGLSDWRAEAWFLGLHLRYLEKRYWRSRYSVSFPRLRPHVGQAIAVTPFSERNLVQAMLAFRLFSREVELSMSCRESVAFRNQAVRLGITSMSAASRTNPGGYADTEGNSLEQFVINDERPPEEVAAYLRSQHYEPVWKDWDSSYDGCVAARG